MCDTNIESTPKQRQDLGFLRKLLKLEDEVYYGLLAKYGVVSCKDLNYYQIYELISLLRDEGTKMGVFHPKKTFVKYKYNNLANRDKSMATPAQLRKIEAMWNDVARVKEPQAREKALKNYIKRIVGKDDMRFLTAVDVRKIIYALERTSK